MKQKSFASAGYDRFQRPTRKAVFLAEMEQVVPWRELCALITPFYPKPGKGRQPRPLEQMLRIYFLQQWFNLSDPAAEEALYDSMAMRSFAGVDLGDESAPDETTICKFRHLLERHDLGTAIFAEVQQHLQAKGLKIGKGTIVDATIIHAPSSTKNRERKRDPEMHQTKKGNQWFFGMKGHIGVDSETRLIHSAAVTAANVADCKVLEDLLHGRERKVWGDQAYRGQGATLKAVAPKARDLTNQRYRHKGVVDEKERARNRIKSKVRARVEHAFGVIKLKFGFSKVRYRGLEKNGTRFFVSCALSNLFMSRRHLLAAAG